MTPCSLNHRDKYVHTYIPGAGHLRTREHIRYFRRSITIHMPCLEFRKWQALVVMFMPRGPSLLSYSPLWLHCSLRIPFTPHPPPPGTHLSGLEEFSTKNKLFKTIQTRITRKQVHEMATLFLLRACNLCSQSENNSDELEHNEKCV
jgi:hypothetical protein